MYEFENIKMYNMDCMEFMKDIPDKFYELAIVDPPYGIGASGMLNYQPNTKIDNIIDSNDVFINGSRVNKPQYELFTETVLETVSIFLNSLGLSIDGII